MASSDELKHLRKLSKEQLLKMKEDVAAGMRGLQRDIEFRQNEIERRQATLSGIVLVLAEEEELLECLAKMANCLLNKGVGGVS